MGNGRKIICIAVVLSFLMTAAYAAPVNRTGILLTQPDGTTFFANIRGDEFFRIKTTSDGCAIIQDKDGYWCYAEYGPDGEKINSGHRVGAKDVPRDVISNSRIIPFDKIGARSRARREADASLSLPPSKAPLTKADGNNQTKHGIIILAEYKDIKMQYTKQDFENLLNQEGYSINGAEGSAKDYFDSQFKGIKNFEFVVSNVVTLSQNRVYYGGNDENDNDVAAPQMIKEACALADAEIDFSIFDDDGDGVVDNVFVFFAGGDEAQYAGDECIWSHAWYLYSGARIKLTLDGKLIDRYACTSELDTKDGKSYTMAPIGTFCHEFSHTMGLPDFYDTDYELSGGEAEGLWGSTSLMDKGNMNNYGRTPPNFNAIEREMLGLSEPVELPVGKILMTPPINGGDVYCVKSDVEGDYYLFECRDNNGWDRKIGGSGLLVYHIDKSKRNSGRSDKYSRFVTAEDRWTKYNEVNCRPDHQCADLIEASAYARNVGNVFFPFAANNSLTPNGKNPIAFWDGSIADISISNISYDDGKVEMFVTTGDLPAPPKAVDEESMVFQDAAVISWKASEPYDGPAYISWAQSNETKVDYEVQPYEPGCYAVVLEGLTPKTAYSADVYFKKDEITGDKTSCNFTTKSVGKTSYPYIYLQGTERNEDGTFAKGCKIPLRVYNATDAKSVAWTYSGSFITVSADGYFHPSRSGELVATVTYPGGKVLTIKKKININ